ncbi:MAG TPA: MMPL family transporter [Solirubrobacteraceae bacterium]|nr:MMPL family transporter [Solirubrobacteraceae bacterium]
MLAPVDGFERVVRAAAHRPRRVLALVALLCAAGTALALGLQPSAATSTLAGRSSDTYQATERYRERFGDHAIVVLARGPLEQLVLTENLGRLLGLEGCLSGNRPAGRPAPGGERGPCAELARSKPVQVVYGPGTFINSAVGEIQDQLKRRLDAKAAQARRAADAARQVARRQGKAKSERERLARSAEQLVYAQFVRDLLALNLKYGLGVDKTPRLDDPDFVATLVFDPKRGATTPKARFAYLFPSSEAAAIQVRLKPRLTDEQRERATALVRAAVRMPEFRLSNADGYTVTGVPVLAEDLADALAGSVLRLLLVAFVVMAAVLALVFRRRLRLVPLAVALAAVALTFGLMALAGAPLTMASVAVLPVLLGLGVDYAIQYQARIPDPPTAAGAEHAARVAVPTIATAALATAAGFLVLLLSPVPMVRGFGALLVVGVGIAFALALTGGTAALVALGTRRADARPHGRAGGALTLGLRRSDGGPLGRSARGAAELLRAAGRPFARLARPARRLGHGVLEAGVGRPGRVVGAGLAVAALGWVVDTQADVRSDLRALVPQDLPAVRDLDTLQRTTGVAGEVDVVVEGRDLTDPKVVAWMRSYQERVLKDAHYTPENGCGKAALCPALSLPDLFQGRGAAADRERIEALLDAVPPYFSESVITADRRTANLAFGIRLMPLDEQHQAIERMRVALTERTSSAGTGGPPAGVTARLAGLPVLAAEANAALASPWRRLGTLLAGLLAVGLVLLLVHRRAERAWVPLVPIALATGWSALVLFALRVPLNPMSATLGALVIALSTEFAVLLDGRYRAERRAGHGVGAALRRTYRSTGAAVLASGATAIAGFAVLAFSDVRMLQEFGIVTVVDLSASLLGVLAVLPAVLVLAERRARRGHRSGAERIADPAVPA